MTGSQKTRNFILHAPNIHIGGGLVLLRSLLLLPNISVKWAQLDVRAEKKLVLPLNMICHFVNHSLFSRLSSEWMLWRRAKAGDVILCFHGLPPLLPTKGHVVVFVQNRVLFERTSLVGYSLFTKVRLRIERLWISVMRRHCQKYIVQTPSMANVVQHRLGLDAKVTVLPFAPSVDLDLTVQEVGSLKQYDFVYVASGEAHKNHHNLLEAWRLLAVVGVKPSLVLTVDSQSFPSLANEITRYIEEYDLNVINLGQVAAMDISRLYQSSSALVFPSKIESFGLPLIEASQLGLPVIASELDFVRDVVQPVETFDPSSPISITRAIRRFLNQPQPHVKIHTAEEFLTEVFK